MESAESRSPEIAARRQMAIHLRLLADALENPGSDEIPVDWGSIKRRVVEIVDGVSK